MKVRLKIAKKESHENFNWEEYELPYYANFNGNTYTTPTALGEALVQYFNSTLRSHEKERIFLDWEEV